MNTTKKTRTGREERSARNAATVTCESVGLDPALYAAALRYLFDRPVPAENEQEWYWNIDEPEFEATPLQWVHIQTVLFANAGTDLALCSDEQVGMGLNYVISNCVSDVSHSVNNRSVPLSDAVRMMKALPHLWRDCIGPRRNDLRQAIGSGSGMLDFVCYMWFDLWPNSWKERSDPEWRDALWGVLRELLGMPWREVQIAALHGLGHNVNGLDRPLQIKALIDSFVRQVKDDEELKNYAQLAASGMVQ